MLKWWRDTTEPERVLYVTWAITAVLVILIAVEMRAVVKKQRAAQAQGEQLWPVMKWKH
jgi:hypothetical protein